MSPDSTNQNIIKRSIPRLLKLLGITFPSDIPSQGGTSLTPDELNSYKPDELRNLPGLSIDDREKKPDLNNIMSQLADVSQSTSTWLREVECLKTLTPEIEASKGIMVGSIMSPTDLQTDSINIVVDDTELGEEVEQKIADLLTNYFNDKIELGPKISEWTGEALYGSGAVAILILPQSNIGLLNKTIDLDYYKAGRDPLKEMKKLTSNSKNKSEPSMESNILTSFESLDVLNSRDKNDVLEKIDRQISTEVIASIESKGYLPKMRKTEIETSAKDASKQIRELLTSNKSHVVISNKLDGINAHETRLTGRIKQLQKEIENNFKDNSDNPLFIVSDEEQEDQNVTILEIPTQAVVPVIIPGSPSKHIGYFVLVDQWGMPLTSESPESATHTGSRKMSESAMQAAFGVPSIYKANSGVTDAQRYDITSDIFGITLKYLLMNKLEEYGLTGTTIENHDAMTACMFRSLLLKKKCGLVFVPEPLMVYYCFKYHPNGTGKSLLHNMSMLLALRTTLLVSYVMAATENSIDNKTIEINVDEKNANMQQLLDMVRNAYVEKKMLRFDNNPITVQRDLIQKSLTIIPKNMRGANEALSVQTDHKQTGSIAPDEGLLEKLTNWIITGFEVPHSALNHTSENEYARGVASTNLFFSNNIKGKQKITIKHSTKLIKNYIRYSSYLQKQIREILRTTEIDKKEHTGSEDVKQFAKLNPKHVPSMETGDTEYKTNVPESKIEVDTNTDSENKNIAKIINGVKLSLPSPKIVVDKAQYREIEEYIGTIEKIVEQVYSDDLLVGEDARNLKDTIGNIRAIIRSSMVRDYIENIGFQSSYALPFIDDIDLKESEDLLMYIANASKKFRDLIKNVIEKSSSEPLPDPNSEPDEPPPDTDDLGGEDTKTDEGEEGGGSPEDVDFDTFEPPPAF